MLQQLKKDLFRSFIENETKIHELNYLFWECTLRCNNNCLHCGSDCSKDSSQHDMPLEDFLSALDTIPEKPENFTVVLTGGEPLLRKDIECCGREIRKRGFRWGMVSNAYLYDKEKHVALLNAGMGALTFSLDGLPQSHNWLRNNNQSFARVDRAIDLAVGASRLNFDIVTCVNQRNIHELPILYQYLLQKGVKSWRLFTITPIGRAVNQPELFLKNKQFKELLDFIRLKRKAKAMDVKFSCEGYVGPYENKVRDGFFFCRAGINIGSVLNDGSIAACPNIDHAWVQGNIYQDNFYEVWQNKYQPFRNREWMKTGKCKDCEEFFYCQGNGMHYRRRDDKEVLVCHYEKLTPMKKFLTKQIVSEQK